MERALTVQEKTIIYNALCDKLLSLKKDIRKVDEIIRQSNTDYIIDEGKALKKMLEKNQALTEGLIDLFI